MGTSPRPVKRKRPSLFAGSYMRNRLKLSSLLSQSVWSRTQGVKHPAAKLQKVWPAASLADPQRLAISISFEASVSCMTRTPGSHSAACHRPFDFHRFYVLPLYSFYRPLPFLTFLSPPIKHSLTTVTLSVQKSSSRSSHIRFSNK